MTEEELIAALLKVEGNCPDSPGISLGITTQWHRNPEGPQAVAALAAKEAELAAVKARAAKLREVAEAFVTTLTDNSMNEDRCLSFRHAELVDCISRARAALSEQKP